MSQAKLVILDTETGGLDARVHPLLSVAMMAVDSTLTEVDAFYAIVLPPEGTLLEVQADPNDTSFTPRIAYLEDIDGNRYECAGNGAPLDPRLTEAVRIQAGAARVNGFTWARWRQFGLTMTQVDDTFAAWVQRWFGEALPKAVAHNASFDSAFVQSWLPNCFRRLDPQWFCTLKAFRALKLTAPDGSKQSNKLVDLAKLVDEDPSTPAYGRLRTKEGSMLDKAHDALADTRMCLSCLLWYQTKHRNM